MPSHCRVCVLQRQWVRKDETSCNTVNFNVKFLYRLIKYSVDDQVGLKDYSIWFVLETHGLTQDEVDLVIRKSKKALGKAKPAMVRLTFHDCVGKI